MQRESSEQYSDIPQPPDSTFDFPSSPEEKIAFPNSMPNIRPIDYIIPDYNFSPRTEIVDSHPIEQLPKVIKLTKKDTIESTCGLFPDNDDFKEQLLKYSNNKLYLPEICEIHKGQAYSFLKLPGELIMVELSCSLTIMSINEGINVHATLTNYRLLFVPNNSRFLIEHHFRSDYFSIPLALISSFKKSGEKSKQLSNVLEIATKCGRKFKLAFSFEDAPAALRLIETMENLVPPPKIYNYFAFSFHSSFPHYEEKYKGWGIYNMQKEYSRQGAFLLPESAPKEEIANLMNLPEVIPFKKFQNARPGKSGTTWVCDTYPPEIIVPAFMEAEDIIKCAKYRTKHRFPALTFCYKFGNEGKVATMWRSSQCKPGFSRNRSNEDEMYLKMIGSCNGKEAKDGTPNLHIYDARPYLNAMANKMNGKGFENLSHYRNAEISFLEIDNIHGVRDKYKKLIDLSANLNPEKLTSSLDYSGWVESLAYILLGAKTIIERSLKQEINVLIHCSDGWDRTTQLNSLVQIMLDPYFRTIEGFEVLIEKDWVSFGHMFKSRNGWKPGNPFEEDKRSPVFIQFLDCVHQLQNQFPAEFEFNLRFLTDIGYYSRTGLFGTFLCDCYEEMKKYGVPEHTTSIWSFINANKDMYKSSLYRALNEHSTFFNREIVPDTSLINLRFWREFFCFYARNALEEAYKNIELDSKINSDLYEITLAMQMKKNDSLKRENDILFSKVNDLYAEIRKLQGESTVILPQGDRDSSPQQDTSFPEEFDNKNNI